MTLNITASKQPSQSPWGKKTLVQHAYFDRKIYSNVVETIIYLSNLEPKHGHHCQLPFTAAGQSPPFSYEKLFIWLSMYETVFLLLLHDTFCLSNRVRCWGCAVIVCERVIVGGFSPIPSFCSCERSARKFLPVTFKIFPIFWKLSLADFLGFRTKNLVYGISEIC